MFSKKEKKEILERLDQIELMQKAILEGMSSIYQLLLDQKQDKQKKDNYFG